MRASTWKASATCSRCAPRSKAAGAARRRRPIATSIFPTTTTLSSGLHASKAGAKTHEQVVRADGGGGGRRNARFVCARASLSVEGDTPRLAVSARWQRGRRRPAARGEALGGDGPAEGGGQPLGRLRGDRHGSGDALAARRLHAPHQHHPLRHQPVPDASRAVRPAARLRLHLARRVVAVVRHRASVTAGQLYYSAAGVGTNPHVAGELFNLLAGVDIVAVQFKGGGPADMALIAGEVGVTFGNISQEVGYVKGGRMRALAVTSAKRNPAVPELPTVAEAGVPGYEFDTWFVVAAPKGTPRAIVDTLNSSIRKVLSAPEQVKFYEERGLTVVASTPEDAIAHLEREQKKWGRVIKER